MQRGWVLDELHPGLVRLSISVTSSFRAVDFWFFMKASMQFFESSECQDAEVDGRSFQRRGAGVLSSVA